MSPKKPDESDTEEAEPKSRSFRTSFIWTNTFNIGQLVTGLGIMVTLVGLYYALVGRLDKQEMRLGSQQEMISRMEIITTKLVESQSAISQTLAVLSSKVEDRRKP